MYTEMPKITRCCFCLPLRYGLLVWAYLKLMWSLFVMTVLIVRCVKIGLQTPITELEVIINAVFAAVFIVEVASTTVFIVGAHKKNPRLLRIYYRYAVVNVVIIFLLYLFAIAMEIYSYVSQWINGLQFIVIQELFYNFTLGTGTLLISFYLLALIKTEILKLEGNTQLCFYNHGTDSKCVIGNNGEVTVLMHCDEKNEIN